MNVFNEPDNELVKDAEGYLRDHKIQELFEVSLNKKDLLTVVCHKRPENLDELLILDCSEWKTTKIDHKRPPLMQVIFTQEDCMRRAEQSSKDSSLSFVTYSIPSRWS